MELAEKSPLRSHSQPRVRLKDTTAFVAHVTLQNYSMKVKVLYLSEGRHRLTRLA